MKWRGCVLVSSAAACVLAVFFLPPIPQSEAYHNFADSRPFAGIPNFLDVASNIFFLPVGLSGIYFLSHKWDKGGTPFRHRLERWPYFAFFVAVALTAAGSSYYHWHPDDSTLVWDRLPMAAGFGAIVAAVVAERISLRLGLRLLGPLILADAATVVYWAATKASGKGDLRPYALAQFGSLLLVLLITALYPSRYTRGADLLIALAIYGFAKVLEAGDRVIFSWGHVVSGHTLKHVAAAFSAFWILRMLKHRVPRLDHPQG